MLKGLLLLAPGGPEKAWPGGASLRITIFKELLSPQGSSSFLMLAVSSCCLDKAGGISEN